MTKNSTPANTKRPTKEPLTEEIFRSVSNWAEYDIVSIIMGERGAMGPAGEVIIYAINIDDSELHMFEIKCLELSLGTVYIDGKDEDEKKYYSDELYDKVVEWIEYSKLRFDYCSLGMGCHLYFGKKSFFVHDGSLNENEWSFINNDVPYYPGYFPNPSYERINNFIWYGMITPGRVTWVNKEE